MERCGEFGQIEYGETLEDLRESLVQLNFQLVRTSEDKLHILEKRMREVLLRLKQENDKELLGILFKMTLHVRDIFQGKGECLLFYMMVLVWYEFYPECAKTALYCSVFSLLPDKKSLGSWKDVKYFCNYCLKKTENEFHPLIEYLIKITNDELRKEYENKINTNYLTRQKSFVAKWIPREKSKQFGWLNKKLATNYFIEYIKTSFDKWRRIKATKKAQTEYRRIISELNAKLDIIETRQCEKKLFNINYLNVPSLTMLKQRKAFLNLNKDGVTERTDEPERIVAASFFKEHLSMYNYISGQTINLLQFGKEALKPNNSLFEKKLINKQWKDSSLKIKTLRSMIPILDCSQKMLEDDAIYGAMALACKIAEKSIIGKRILCFSSYPIWVNFDDEDCEESFTGMMEFLYKKIKNGIGLTSNLHGALDELLEIIEECELSVESVEEMMLVIISGMQFEKDASGGKNDTLYKMIKNKFNLVGMSTTNKLYHPPHICFWNVKQVNGFPSSSNERNVSMMSGFSQLQLNAFRENITQEPKICTPWSMLSTMLNKKRYNIVKDVIENYLE